MRAKKHPSGKDRNGEGNGRLKRALVLGQVLNYLGLNAVKMLFSSAVINGLLAPPLILLVVLLTSSHKVMGKRVNPPLLRYLGWATFAVMTAAAVGMFVNAGGCNRPEKLS
jgi:Mn2+/Fe2+ NRAMP family transporter